MQGFSPYNIAGHLIQETLEQKKKFSKTTREISQQIS
jgi:hypothetical protein